MGGAGALERLKRTFVPGHAKARNREAAQERARRWAAEAGEAAMSHLPPVDRRKSCRIDPDTWAAGGRWHEEKKLANASRKKCLAKAGCEPRRVGSGEEWEGEIHGCRPVKWTDKLEESDS